MHTVLDAAADTDRFGKNSVKHLKPFLSGAFKIALQRGYYPGTQNPLQQTSLPKTRPAEDTYAYSLEEINSMLRVLPEPTATIIAAAAYTGLRRSELLGLVWENFTGRAIFVEQSISNGIATDPKSNASKAFVPIIKRLQVRLDILRELQGSPRSGPIFPIMSAKPQTSATSPTAKCCQC